MTRLPLPPQHRGVSSKIEGMIFTVTGRALIAVLLGLALAVGSHFRI
jgi:hypothetical protein